jgi:hypothetical protein
MLPFWIIAQSPTPERLGVDVSSEDADEQELTKQGDERQYEHGDQDGHDQAQGHGEEDAGVRHRPPWRPRRARGARCRSITSAAIRWRPSPPEVGQDQSGGGVGPESRQHTTDGNEGRVQSHESQQCREHLQQQQGQQAGAQAGETGSGSRSRQRRRRSTPRPSPRSPRSRSSSCALGGSAAARVARNLAISCKNSQFIARNGRLHLHNKRCPEGPPAARKHVQQPCRLQS